MKRWMILLAVCLPALGVHAGWGLAGGMVTQHRVAVLPRD